MRVIFYLIWALLLIIVQPTLVRDLAIWGIAPNLFLCFAVIIGLFRGNKEGAVCGAVFGLLYDFLLGRMIGVNALIYLYLGLGSGILGTQFFRGEKRLITCLVAVVGTLVAGLIYYLAQKAIGSGIGFVTAVFRISLLEAIYNGVMAALLLYPIRWSMKLMRMKVVL